MNSRQKGARGEREWAAYLRAQRPHLDLKRGIQSRGGGKEAADVYGLPGFHMEVKRVERLNIWAALVQAETDAGPVGPMPIVAFRQNRSPWYVAQRAIDWIDLAIPCHT